MNDSISAKDTPLGVVLTRRTWDGIDRPEYEKIATINSLQAKVLATELLNAVESAAKRERLRELPQQIGKLQTELEALQAELGS